MSGMTVSVAFEPTQQASIVTLADANGAKPFIYQFAIENRRPVMYYGGYTDTLNARNPHYVEAQQTLAAKMVRGPLVSSPGICDPLATDPQARRECADVCYQTNPWHLNMAGALLPISINVTDPDDEITDEALGIKQLQPTCEIVHDDAYTSIPWEQTDIDGAFVNVIGCTPSIESIDAPAGNIIHELRLQTMATCSPALKSASRPFTFKVAVYDAAGASYDTTFLGKVTDPLTGCFVVNGPHPRNGAAVYGACCSGPNAPKLIRQGNQCCKGSKEAIDDPTFCAACSEEGAAPTPRGGCCTGFTAYEHPCQGWICIPDNEAMACDLSDSACGGGCRGFDSRDQDPDPAITDMQCVQIC